MRNRGVLHTLCIGLVVGLACLGAAQSATAQGFYVGGAWIHAAINETVVDDNSNAYKFTMGYEGRSYFGFEASWVDFGEFDGVITAAGGSTNVGYDAKTATAAITMTIPIGEAISLHAKGGYLFWSTDVKLSGTVVDPEWEGGSDNGSDPFYGAGVRINLGKVSVVGEWERFKLNKVDIDAVSAGLRFYF